MINPEQIPDGHVFAPHHFYIGILVAVFAFVTVWKWYPTLGAMLTLVGVLVALDDVIQHAFQVDTPLHHLWWIVLYPVVRWIES